MRIFTVSVLSIMLLASSVEAFSFPLSESFDSKEARLKACMLQEAQQALAKGELTKDNLEAQSAKIAASCATKTSVKNDAATLKLATMVIKSLLK